MLDCFDKRCIKGRIFAGAKGQKCFEQLCEELAKMQTKLWQEMYKPICISSTTRMFNKCTIAKLNVHVYNN
jgi:hypothetical protein